MSKVMLSEERLAPRTRALCGLGALVMVPLSGLVVFASGLPLSLRVFSFAFLLIGLCLTLFAILGRRSPFLEALVDTLMSVPI